MAVIIPTMALLGMNGPADKDTLKSERRYRVVGAEAKVEMMVARDDDGREGRGRTMMEATVMGGQVEAIGEIHPPGLDTRAKSMLLWRSLMQTQMPSKRPSIPFSMGSIPNPSRKRLLRPILV